MLERASPSIECTAQLFLKTFDRPVKSYRVLDPTFWKNAGDNVPSWWPAYLQTIRDKADIHNQRSHAPDTSAPTSPRISKAQYHDHVHRAGRLTNGRQNMRSRAFAGVSSRQQQSLSPAKALDTPTDHHVAVRSDYDAEQAPDQRQVMSARKRDEGQRASVPSSTPRSSHVDGAATTYETVWKLFIQSGHKQEVAASMLRYLASSTIRSDLRHALMIFEFIPTKQRSKEDYETVLEVAIKCQNFKVAIGSVVEALSKGYGKDIYFKLVAHCVDRTLWNTLATLWESVGLSSKALRQAKQASSKSRSPNMAGEYAFHFDSVVDLPGKITSLSMRLLQPDAVLAAHRATLVEICKRLAYIAVESPAVMTTISAEGMLAVLNVQEQLGFNSKLHLAAIGTIRRMHERGSRSRMAMLIYRNYTFTHPGAAVPRWVYGALIGICANARESSDTYEFILDEMSRRFEHPDDWSYQQVMAACARQGEVSALFRIFEEYRRHFKPKDLRDVNHLLHVFAVTGDCENAQVQFHRLSSDFGFTPDVVSWTLLLLAHARSLRAETAFEVFHQMRQAGVKPNSISWSILVNVAAARADTAKARQLYEQSKQEGVPESAYIQGAIVESLLRNDQIEEAEALVLEYSQTSLSESPIRLWNSLYRHHAFRLDTDAIHRLQGLMKNLKIHPDAMTYAALMTALVVKGQTSDAVKIVRALYFSQQLNPTEFHYSILIHGFVQEGNRDMATTMYHEMLEHFPRASASAKLAMLHLRLEREGEAWKHASLRPSNGSEADTTEHFMPWQSLEYLADVLADDIRIDAASPSPNPGFRRQAVRSGLEAMYFGSLISFLQRKQAGFASEKLLRATQAMVSPSKNSPTTVIGTLTLKLSAAIESRRWAEADAVWNDIVTTGTKSFCRVQESITPWERPKQPHNIRTVGDREVGFRSMLPPTTSQQGQNRVLGAHRFALSWPLSIYLQGLNSQRRHHDAVLVMQKVTNAGFTPSGRNWNRYVQVLSTSTEFEHRLFAFKLFEKYLLPHAPHWNLIRRGKWLPSPHIRATHSFSGTQPQSRAKLERSNSAMLMPSYFTMIHLATALVKAHRAMVSGDPLERNKLQEAAPATVELVRQTPYLADRIQGVLLRGRPAMGDRLPRPRARTLSKNIAGLKGSRSPLDNVPDSVLEDLEKVLMPTNDTGTATRTGTSRRRKSTILGNIAMRYDEHIRHEEARSGAIAREPQYLEGEGRFENQSEMRSRVEASENALLKPLLDLADRIMGEMLYSPQILAAQGRIETDQEVRKRLKLQTVQRLDVMDQIRQDFHDSTTTTSIYRGIKAIAPISQRVTNTDFSPDPDFVPPGLTILQKLLDKRSAPDTATGKLVQTKKRTRRYINSRAININPLIIRRRVGHQYRSDGVIQILRPEPRRRGAWSLNKARRLRLLQEKQTQTRTHRRILKANAVKQPKQSRAKRDEQDLSDGATGIEMFKLDLARDASHSR